MAHELAWYLTIVLAALIGAIVLYVSHGASAAAGSTPAAPYRWRGPLFWVLIVVGVLVTFASLRPWPIEAYAGVASNVKVIKVTGHQWRWELSDNTVRVGEPVEFHLTSGDVNHGFGIYENRSRLLTQAQAMPGFVNKLRYTFSTPGQYEVLCLEYCGLAHHGMAAQINVVAN